MNTQLVKIIRTFLNEQDFTKLKKEDVAPSRSLDKAIDEQWALLTSLATFRKESQLNEVANILKICSEVKGASELAKEWIGEGKRRNIIETVLFGDVESGADGKQKKRITITAADHYLIKRHVELVKEELLKLINEQGGITKFAKAIDGISQSNLSRFFNTDGVPRTSTLQKIFKGLKVKKIEIEL